MPALPIVDVPVAAELPGGWRLCHTLPGGLGRQPLSEE
jgi:hypothetical protein